MPSVGREEIEMKLKQVISDSAESNTLTIIDWANIPLPQHIILDERQHSGLKYPDLSSKAGEEPSPEESDESMEEDEVESENGSDSTELLRTAEPGLDRGIASKDHQCGPTSNERIEALYLETPNFVNPSVKQAGVSVDGNLQVLNSQEVVEKTKRRRITWKVCDDCHRFKRKVSILAD